MQINVNFAGIENVGRSLCMDCFFSSPAVFGDLHTKTDCCEVVIPGGKGMPKSFGQKIKLKWDDIKTAVRSNLIDVVWRDR
jgi:hypothetical protein